MFYESGRHSTVLGMIKWSLSAPWKHVGIIEVWLHPFLAWAMLKF